VSRLEQFLTGAWFADCIIDGNLCGQGCSEERCRVFLGESPPCLGIREEDHRFFVGVVLLLDVVYWGCPVHRRLGRHFFLGKSGGSCPRATR
jgi:hypothetical protein